jgi:hypothetical protein
VCFVFERRLHAIAFTLIYWASLQLRLWCGDCLLSGSSSFGRTSTVLKFVLLSLRENVTPALEHLVFGGVGAR